MSTGVCVHRQCEANSFRRMVCSKHYWQLQGGRPIKLPPKEKPLTAREKQQFDPEDFWSFVQDQVLITKNKVVTIKET